MTRHGAPRAPTTSRWPTFTRPIALPSTTTAGVIPAKQLQSLRTRSSRRRTCRAIVLVDSFELLSTPEIRLLAALAERTEVAIALDPEGSERARWTAERIEQLVPGAQREQLPPQASSAAISAHTAANTEAQLRGMARASKRTLTEDTSLRPSDVAVVFRQATPHLSLARRVFQEYDLPFDPAAG